MKRPRNTVRRRGVSLLEVLTASTLSATLIGSSFVVLRSSQAAWLAHEADLQASGEAAALLRHLVRHVRQAESMSAISASADTSGSLSVVRDDGSTLTWSHSGTSVTLQEDAASPQPLADDIATLRFEGYLADGTTLTTDPNDIQSVRAVLTYAQPAGGVRTVSCNAWVRSW